MALVCLGLGVLVGCGGPAPTGTGVQTPKAPATMEPMPSPPKVERATVRFLTEDKIELVGWVYGQGKTTAVICLHMYPESRKDWESSAPFLAARGYMVLAFDFRGFGESGGQYSGEEGLEKDVLAGMEYVKAQGAKKIVLMGASMGSTMSLLVAAKKGVAAVVAMSPWYGTFLGGTLTLSKESVEQVRAPKLFIASEEDSGVGTREVYRDAKTPKEIHVYPGSDHGTRIFDGPYGGDLVERIVEFLDRYVGVG